MRVNKGTWGLISLVSTQFVVMEEEVLKRSLNRLQKSARL